MFAASLLICFVAGLGAGIALVISGIIPGPGETITIDRPGQEPPDKNSLAMWRVTYTPYFKQSISTGTITKDFKTEVKAREYRDRITLYGAWDAIVERVQ